MKKIPSIGFKSGAATAGIALKASVVLLLILVFGLVSCDSDLLSSPPAATAIEISGGPTVATANTDATISWKTNRSTKMYIEYGISSGTYTQSVPPEATASADHALNLSGLSYSTMYYYRVVSSGGTSTFYSTEFSFVSSADLSDTFAITGTPASTPASNTAVISWDTNIASTFSIEYGTTSGTYSVATPHTATGTLSHTPTLTALSASTAYFYRIVSGVGLKRYASVEYGFTTAADPNASFAITTSTTIRTSNSFMVNWSSNIASTFSFEYGTATGVYTAATPHSSALETSHVASISGLSSTTQYFYRIVSGIGLNRYYSAEFTFTTAASSTLNVSVGPSTTLWNSSISVVWTTNAACKVTLEYGTMNGTYTNSTPISASASTSHTVNITGLSPGTTYYYRLWLIGTTENATSIVYSAITSTVETEPTLAKRNRGIWMLGGLSGSSFNVPTTSSTLGTVDLFDPVTNAWHAAVTTLPTPVSFAAYAAYNGKLYVFGGFDSSGVVRDLVQIYTISTNTWTAGATLPSGGRANVQAVVVFDRIYLLGGTTGNAAAAWAVSLATLEYSTGGNLWSTRTNFSATNVSDRFSYNLDNAIYNIGGRSAAAAVAAVAHDGYVCTTFTLTTGITETAMVVPRTGVAGSIFKSSTAPAAVVLVGGVSALTGTTGCFINTGTSAATFSNSVQFLSAPFAATITWMPVVANTFPALVAFGASAVSTSFSPARMYHFGGTTAVSTSAAGQDNVYWVDAPAPPAAWAGTWTAATNMSTGRWGHGAVTLNQ